MLKCWPHYMPQEFTIVFVVTVYVPPDANANTALEELHEHIGVLQNKHPEALFIVDRDFNHVKLMDTLPQFHEHVTIATRGNNTLDQVYTNRREAYRAVSRPHLGFSDHVSVMLTPVHCPVLRHNKPTQKNITVWPNTAGPMLQDCFGKTNWQIFKEAVTSGGGVDLEDYILAICSYISKCINDVMVTRRITIRPKPETLVEWRSEESPESARCSLQIWGHAHIDDSEEESGAWN